MFVSLCMINSLGIRTEMGMEVYDFFHTEVRSRVYVIMAYIAAQKTF